MIISSGEEVGSDTHKKELRRRSNIKISDSNSSVYKKGQIVDK